MPSPGLLLHGPADGAWRRRGPTPRAVRAYDARAEELRPLAGGQGLAWSDGRLVLKPVGCEPEHDWVCGVYAAWPASDVRVPEPVRPAGSEDWSVDGWGAQVLLPGRDAEPAEELDQILAASDRFHDTVAGLARPSFLDERDDPWAYGDRLAWEDGVAAQGDEATLAAVDRVRRMVAPVSSADQVVHGDVLPNVLLHRRLPPAVIDWPPYFRPVGFAAAVAVTDAVTFHGVPLDTLDLRADEPDWHQLLVRAVLYRLGTTGVFAARHRLLGSLVDHVERVGPVVEALADRQPRP